MKTQRTIASYSLVVLLGAILGVVLGAKDAQAWGCDMNACSLQSKDCFVTDMHISCKETSGDPGCETTGCQAN
jgi:hypothetical protein